MSVGFFEIPIFLFALAIPVVVIVLIVNAVGKHRNGMRTLVVGLMAVAIVFVLLLGFLALAVIGTRTAVYHNQTSSLAPGAAVAQAQAQVERAEAQVDQARAQVESQVAQAHAQVEAQITEAQARIQSATTPGDRIMVEDPTTQAVQQLDGVQPLQVVDENPPSVVATPPAPPTAPAPAGVTVAGQPWTEAVEEHQDFEADVYPSLESAAEALGRRAGQRLMTFIGASHEPAHTVYVWRDDADGNVSNGGGELVITRDVLEATAQGLRQKVASYAEVSIETPPTRDDMAVRVGIQEVRFENHNRWRSQAESRSGAVALRVKAPQEQFSISTKFTDAPWLVDRTGFDQRFPNGDWIVGYSDTAHSSHESARRDALAKAAETLLPLAQARISQLSASDQHNFQQMARDPNWLRDRLADELVSRNLSTDRFAQSFERPYGTVWREAVLVNASPSQVEAIARSLVQGINVQVTHQRKTWFSFVALAGLILGTYLFLNMATKGYYVWMLRLAALGGVAAAGILILHLARQGGS